MINSIAVRLPSRAQSCCLRCGTRDSRWGRRMLSSALLLVSVVRYNLLLPELHPSVVSVSELMLTASQRHVLPLQGRPYAEDKVEQGSVAGYHHLVLCVRLRVCSPLSSSSRMSGWPGRRRISCRECTGRSGTVLSISYDSFLIQGVLKQLRSKIKLGKQF